MHGCSECGAEYVCEEEGCLAGFAELCPVCRKWPMSHALYAQNVAKHDPVYAAKLARIDARQRGFAVVKSSDLLQIMQPKTADSAVDL